MKIETCKTYLTRGGEKVRVLCTDLKGGGDYPIICAVTDNTTGKENICSYTTQGFRWENDPKSEYNLVSEYSFWNDVEIDTPIYVKDSEDTEWRPRHFAKYDNGIVETWRDGHTSFSMGHNTYTTSWDNAKLADDK